MSPGTDRLIRPADLPSSLWEEPTATLSLPPSLAAIYRRLVDERGLEALANSRDRKDAPVGGPSQERTDQHFAQAFDGSVARTQLALLDPLGRTADSSNAFLSCLAGNEVLLTDVPCGAGAAAFGFLATIAELRAQSVLPRHPLDIHLIGAELSEPARRYAEIILADLTPALEEQAITVQAEFFSWDVLDALSNTDLIKRMSLTRPNAAKRLLVVANFNGFLARSGKLKEAQPRLEELFRHASGDNSLAIWIEPDMKGAIGEAGVLTRLWEWVSGPWRRFTRSTEGSRAPHAIATCAARFYLPLNPLETARVTLAVMTLQLARSE